MIIRFVAPSIFPEKISESFIDYFDQVSSDSTRAAKLHSILKKFMLRREKSQVAAELPRKEEVG